MLVSNKAKDLLKGFEGLQLTAYKCPAGVWTIGYGSTGSHVKPGMTITKEQADILLNKDITPREDKLTRILGRTPTTQNQFDALFLLAYNIGMGAFEKSTLLRLHRNAQYEEAADEFLKWNKAGGKVLNGLTRRRSVEREVYIGQGTAT
jgi:lysozyme